MLHVNLVIMYSMKKIHLWDLANIIFKIVIKYKLVYVKINMYNPISTDIII